MLPDFTLRVAKRVHAVGTRHADYQLGLAVCLGLASRAAPKPWPNMSIICSAILPFEPEVHRHLEGPPCSYVGHPLLGQAGPDDTQSGRTPRDSPKWNGLYLLVLARQPEFRNQAPDGTIFANHQSALAERGIHPRFIMPTVPNAAKRRCARWRLKSWSHEVEVVVGEDEKWQAFRSAHAALAASGTVTLELALAGVPHLAAYQTDALIKPLRRFIRTWTIVLPNLVLGRPAIREYFDELLRPETMARQLEMLLTDTPERRALIESLSELRGAFKDDGREPSGPGCRHCS
jgi:lipid-A-disaccharide synthase